MHAYTIKISNFKNIVFISQLAKVLENETTYLHQSLTCILRAAVVSVLSTCKLKMRRDRKVFMDCGYNHCAILKLGSHKMEYSGKRVSWRKS